MSRYLNTAARLTKELTLGPFESGPYVPVPSDLGAICAMTDRCLNEIPITLRDSVIDRCCDPSPQCDQNAVQEMSVAFRSAKVAWATT